MWPNDQDHRCRADDAQQGTERYRGIRCIRWFGFLFSRCRGAVKLALTEIKLQFQGRGELNGGSETLPGFDAEILQGANLSFRYLFL
jgi:hypothetical protein